MFQRKIAPYVFHGQTVSLCEECLAPIAACSRLSGVMAG